MQTGESRWQCGVNSVEEGLGPEAHLRVGPLWGEVCDGAKSRRELGGWGRGAWSFVADELSHEVWE